MWVSNNTTTSDHRFACELQEQWYASKQLILSCIANDIKELTTTILQVQWCRKSRRSFMLETAFAGRSLIIYSITTLYSSSRVLNLYAKHLEESKETHPTLRDEAGLGFFPFLITRRWKKLIVPSGPEYHQHSQLRQGYQNTHACILWWLGRIISSLCRAGFGKARYSSQRSGLTERNILGHTTAANQV